VRVTPGAYRKYTSMKLLLLSFLFSLFGISIVNAIHVPGSLEVDLYTFGKLAPSNNLLVVFQAQSWKEINKFDQVAKELRDREDVLVVRFDGSNERDAPVKEKYGVTSLPAVFFLAKGSSTPVLYHGQLESGSSGDSLVQWVRVQLTPSLSALDDIAKKFSGASAGEQTKLLAQAQQLAGKLTTSQDVEIGKVYTRTLENIQKQGVAYVEKEKTRLKGLIDAKATTQAKKDEFSRRLTILDSFTAQQK